MALIAPVDGDPELSVVMVSHGAWPLTERAIAALIENTPWRVELILVDNGSDPSTRAALSAVPGARLILNDGNRGFGPASNQGAAQARGRYLVLLNTDAFVHAGWFEPLRAALDRDGVGAAVPRLLNEDGSLQDAGALLARDGTVWEYGNGDDARRLCYRFRRYLDFGCGACMVLRRDTFVGLGGFDERFSPAYYEDADLCLRLARHGLKTVYEPSSTVTHVGHGSGGLARAVELSARNRNLFLERWGSHLTGRPWTFEAASEQAVVNARDAGAEPRVLVCAPEAEGAAADLGHAVLEAWPSARVTWATGAPLAHAADCSPWIELADQPDPGWLEHRLFHYDVVVSSDEPDPRLDRVLQRTQPQARCLSLRELGAMPARQLSDAIGCLAPSAPATGRATQPSR